MKRLIILIIALISISLLVTDLAAQDNFLWEINNAGNKIYLLGSIHLMPNSIYPLAEVIENSYKEADHLVIEADPATVDQQKLQEIIMQKGIYPQGQSLKTEIDSTLYRKVSEIFKQFNTAMAQVDMYKPWFVSLNLGIMEMQKLGMRPENGIDVHFIAQAKADGKQIIELESGLKQMEILTSFPEEEQEDYLAYSINNYESASDLLNKMLTAWQQGDADLMNETIKVKLAEFIEDHPGMKAFYDRIFLERDKAMVEKLKGFLEGKEEKTYFVVVGSGHIIGQDGILDQLQKLGYAAEQL